MYGGAFVIVVSGWSKVICWSELSIARYHVPSMLTLKSLWSP
jgi:hypothetical protein